MRDLSGRVIILTGASAGIGAATAVECARAGMDCVLNGLNTPKLEAVARRVGRLGRRAVAVPGCVTEPGAAAQLLDAAQREFGRFDAVLANAGYGWSEPIVDMSMIDLRRMFDVNFFASVELLCAAAKRLIDEGGRGHLLMCSSCAARFSFPAHGAYAATKAAQAQVCTAMRAELAPRGIQVSSVHPIVTRTEFFRSIARRQGRGVNGDCLPPYCPRFMVQEPQRVALAIVRCLRRPRAEVWTCWPVRAFAAIATLWPWPLETVMRRHVQRELRFHEDHVALKETVADG